MVWLLLSILTNSALLLILKSFSKYGVNTFHGIVVNYITAGGLGLLIFGMPVAANEIPQQEWAWMPPVLGLLFISIFRLIAMTAQEMGVATATVANKMSVVIPVAFALIFLNEDLTFIQYFGMGFTLVAVYLTALPASGTEQKHARKFWLPALVFIGSGIIDAIINYAGQHSVPSAHIPFFISLSFLSAFVIGLLIMIWQVFIKNEKVAMKSVLGGIVLGIPNYFSIYGIARALESDFLPSTALYPVNNIGIVLVSAIGALLIFREKLSKLNWLGIGISVAAIALMAFGKL